MLPLFDSLGAKYLWGYLQLICWTADDPFEDNDFILFAIYLRNELDVLNATMKKYIMDA